MDALWLLATVVAPLLLAMALSYAIIRERLEIRSGEKGRDSTRLRARCNQETDDRWR